MGGCSRHVGDKAHTPTLSADARRAAGDVPGIDLHRAKQTEPNCSRPDAHTIDDSSTATIKSQPGVKWQPNELRQWPKSGGRTTRMNPAARLASVQ